MACKSAEKKDISIMDYSNLQTLLQHFTKIGPPGCALSVSHKGRVIFEHYEGFADIETQRPVDKDTVYHMWSCTKVVTITAAMILYERGKFLLCDPIERYLPCFSNPRYFHYEGSDTPRILPCRSIQVVDLMRMTSGLPYGGTNNLTQQELLKIGGFWPNENVTLQEFVAQIATIPLAFEPGTHWSYGFGFDVLGALIEIWSGKSYGQFLVDEIFGPLGMKHTALKVSDALRPHMASTYTIKDGRLVKDESLDYAFEPENKYESGGAGIISTLGDMATFSRMLAMGGTLNGQRIIGRSTIDLIRMNHLKPHQLADFRKVQEHTWPNMLGYGYGLGVRTMIDPAAGGSNGNVGEFGWSGAAGTWNLIDPEAQLSAEYAHQLMPSTGNMQEYCHPRIRNAIYALVGKEA